MRINISRHHATSCYHDIKSRRLTRMYARGMRDALSACRPPNIPPQSNSKITQGSRESPTQVNSSQASPATHIHTTLPMLSTKPTAPVTHKAKRRRSWVSDTDMILDVSEQEHVRPNSDVFDSPLTTPTRYHHDDQEIVHANRQKLCRRRSHSSSCS